MGLPRQKWVRDNDNLAKVIATFSDKESANKKVHLFAGINQDMLSGGILDYMGTFETVRKAFEQLEKLEMVGFDSWYHVVDAETMELILGKESYMDGN